MTEQEIRALLNEHENGKSERLCKFVTKRKTALKIVIDNLLKEIEALPPTAQDVISIYTEIVSKLYNDYAW